MTSSFLAQASAVLALYQLTPVIINLDVNRIFGILEILIKWLPGQLEAPEAPVLQTAYGLGLGGFLERLFEEHFLDTCGSRVILYILISGRKIIIKQRENHSIVCLNYLTIDCMLI